MNETRAPFLPGVQADPLSTLRLGHVTVSVADLPRSLAFYTQALGMRVLERETGRALLGSDVPLLELIEEPGAGPSRGWHAGLYHLALLLPTRADLGRFVRHLMDARWPVVGASDHLVSEALYLQDPDGHGLEVCADRPAEAWRWREGADGRRQVEMDTRAADIAGLAAAAGSTPWTGVPDGTTVGHVHLRVADVERARAFYAGLLGLGVVADLSAHGALFVSARGYHHHLGLNSWESRGGQSARPGEARLLGTRLGLQRDELDAARARLTAGGVDTQDVDAPDRTAPDGAAGFSVLDPSGTRLTFSALP